MPDEMCAVAGHDIESAAEVRDVLKLCRVRGKYNVTEHRDLGVHAGGAVDGGDHRHMDVEQVLHEAPTFPVRAVPTRGRREIPIAAGELAAELIAGAGQKDHFRIRIIAEIAEQGDTRPAWRCEERRGGPFEAVKRHRL